MTATRHSLEQIARFVRKAIIQSTTAAGSGHPTSSLSAVELMVGLLFSGIFRADLNQPKNPDNDRLIFSKGHAAPLLYALYAAAGKVSIKELLSLRKHHSRLEGHPMPSFPYTEVPTGSLGQGLSAGIGVALAARIDRRHFQTYVLLGDSEMAEGSVWEALQLAGHLKLHNLTAIVDVNRLGQSGPTMLGHDVQSHSRRIAAFGWKTLIVDGHNLSAVVQALRTARSTHGQPTCIITKTVKGKGVSFLENKNGWHGWALTTSEAERALSEIGKVSQVVRGRVAIPKKNTHVVKAQPVSRKISYDPAVPVATRTAIGNALVRLAPAYPRLVVLDAEVRNSTYTEKFEHNFPERFIETYIAEQNMLGIANGLAARGKLPVASTFSAFLTRGYDQLRMSQYSQTHQIVVGTHAGVSIGKDGASQMGLEDIAMFRTLGNSTVLYPSDAIAAERLTEVAVKHSGIVYLRGTRAATQVLYPSHQTFTLGGSHTLRTSKKDRLTIVAAGITLFEALKAADTLAERRVRVRIVDLYSIKPIDARTLQKAAKETRHILVVEDHRPEGGVAEAVRSALGKQAGAVTSLAVHTTPHSGTMAETLNHAGISAGHIIRVVTRLTASR